MLDESLTDNLINRRLDKAGRDVFPVPVTVPIVRNEGFVGFDVVLELAQCFNSMFELEINNNLIKCIHELEL
jgi:hypothetical protein